MWTRGRNCYTLLLNCNKYSHIKSDLHYTLEDVCSKLKRNFTIGGKVQLLLAPANKYNIKKETILNSNNKRCADKRPIIGIGRLVQWYRPIVVYTIGRMLNEV